MKKIIIQNGDIAIIGIQKANTVEFATVFAPESTGENIAWAFAYAYTETLEQAIEIACKKSDWSDEWIAELITL